MNSVRFDAPAVLGPLVPPVTLPPTPTRWRSPLPVLTNGGVTLRELRQSDALPLLAMLTTAEVTRFISPPPVTQAGFERFISWSHRMRAEGLGACFGVVPAGYTVAVGVLQLQTRAGEPPEWGCALGSPFWGTGTFARGAEAMLDFAFHGLGLDTLSARAAVANRRGNAALQKIGAVCDRIIEEGIVRNGQALDQYGWTVTPQGRPRPKVVWEQPAH